MRHCQIWWKSIICFAGHLLHALAMHRGSASLCLWLFLGRVITTRFASRNISLTLLGVDSRGLHRRHFMLDGK